MTGPDSAATVPDEAIQRIVEALHPWCCDHDCQQANEIAGKIAPRVLAALAEAGWVLVPGPVHTEWSNTYTDTGERWPRPDEATARECATDAYPAVAAEYRQATEWRPASTQDGDQ